MSKKNRFQSNFNQNGQPVVEEEDMENMNQVDSQEQSASAETPVAAPQVVEAAPVIEEVKKEVPVFTTPAKTEEVVKDSTTIEHSKVSKNVKVEAVKQSVEKISIDASAQAIIENARKSTNSYIIGLVNFLDNYMKKMSPGLVAGDREGGMTQFNFHGTIVQLLNNPDYDLFRNGLLILCAYFNAFEKSAFNERYLFRFSEQWPAGADKLTNFHATLNLLKIIANKEERPVGKFISLERTYNTGFTELAKENISRFLKTA